jgi:hypothetical protein
MTVLLLHAGTHKTATTSLQAMFAEQSADLEQQGLYYPRAGRYLSGHHNAVWGLYGDRRFDAAAGDLDDVVAEMAGRPAGPTLISSEDLEYLHRRPEQLCHLRDRFLGAGYEPHVVLFLREPVSYFESLYLEMRHHGLTQAPGDVCEDIIGTGGLTLGDWDFRFDYAELVAGFEGVFGPRAVTVAPYQQRDALSATLNLFSTLLSMPLEATPNVTRHNVRRASRGPQLRRRLRRLAGQRAGAEPPLPLLTRRHRSELVSRFEPIRQATLQRCAVDARSAADRLPRRAAVESGGAA